MNPYKVKTWGEIEKALRDSGYEPTGSKTATGEFWRCSKSGRHIQVPNSLDDMYPNYIYRDLIDRIEKAGSSHLH